MGAEITYIVGNKFSKRLKQEIEEFIYSTFGVTAAVNCHVRYGDAGIHLGASIPEHEQDADYTLFSLELTEMPSCCAFLVSHSLYIHPKYRGKGLGSFLQKIKLDIARGANYPYMLCTTIQSNKVENHLLEKFGWKISNTIVNTRTGNTVHMWIKEVGK